MWADLNQQIHGVWRMRSQEILAELKEPGSTDLTTNPLNDLLEQVPSGQVSTGELNNFAMNILKSERIWAMFEYNDQETVGQNIMRLAQEYGEEVSPKEVASHTLQYLSKTHAEFLSDVKEAVRLAGSSFDALQSDQREAEGVIGNPEERSAKFSALKDTLLVVYQELRKMGYGHQELVD